MIEKNDEKWMKLALKLAKKGAGDVNPNPMVGAVIVKNDRIISTGFHKEIGKEHAEVVAINNSNENTENATLYVTLEPCNFYGLTPPCTDAILKANFSRVVIATEDPNPKVNGKGIEILRNAGIRVETGVLEEYARELNQPYFKWIKTGNPWILIKVGSSIDGRIATKYGESQWITGVKSRKFGYKLRDFYDAVVVGSNTALLDNPDLGPKFKKRKRFYRIVISSSGKLNIDSNLVNLAKDNKVVLVHCSEPDMSLKKTLEDRGVIFWKVKGDNNGLVSLHSFIERLKEEKIQSIIVEGGGRLISSFLRQRLFDQLIVEIASKVIGNGILWAQKLNIESLSDAINFSVKNWKKIEDEIIFCGYVNKFY